MGIEGLKSIMARLRDPDGGCPWDIEQTFATIAPYTIEEAYEVADAIERGDRAALKDELGDLLLQVVYHAQMAAEEGQFAFDDVVGAISDKMVRRHPHVFGDVTVTGAAAQTIAWEELKAAERAEGGENEETGALAGVARGLPALLRAFKLQKRAARVHFDWPDAAGAMDKLGEELEELDEELKAPRPDAARLKDEMGDVLFSMVNLARKLEIDPEEALRHANHKFESRFSVMERSLTDQGRAMRDASLDEMMVQWDAAKEKE
ncbi:MAG: nucleoside triphosphate pyrophosphohydrolase, partial [Rhodospirillales bacterium]|nr:nucleoside triphosphate pyrophosphohydrolase [Rhodospirillales bacterium]